MRTFIAIEIPDEIQRRVGSYIESIEGMFRDVKWVAPENLHFTIKFLGEIEETDSRKVRECIDRAADEYGPFIMGLSGVGFFPAETHPKVIWIGADGGEDNLIDIFHDMESRLEECGFDRESKTFSPHLTIGRVKKDRKLTIPAGFPDFEPVTFEVSGLALMKSTLTPDGPIYDRICGSELHASEGDGLGL